MKIYWNIVDQILNETESTAQQLFDWMNDPEVMGHHFPCTSGHPYLDKYSFVEAGIFGDEVSVDEWPDSEFEIYVPEIAACVEIYDFWSDWCSNDQFRANMRRDFKRRYKL